MTQKSINFEVKGKSFKAGYYTVETFNGIQTYWLVYTGTAKNRDRINNSGLMLEYFAKLPKNVTINKHLNNKHE